MYRRKCIPTQCKTNTELSLPTYNHCMLHISLSLVSSTHPLAFFVEYSLTHLGVYDHFLSHLYSKLILGGRSKPWIRSEKIGSFLKSQCFKKIWVRLVGCIHCQNVGALLQHSLYQFGITSSVLSSISRVWSLCKQLVDILGRKSVKRVSRCQ